MATPDDTPFPTAPLAGTGGTASLDELNEAGVPRSTLGTGSTAGPAGGNDMLQRVVQGAHQTIDRLAETAAPHVQRLTEGVQTGTGQMRETADEWTENLRTTVRENPLAAVATALAVGLLIARITR